jgi:predicted RNase H-like HicB family nuclease
VVWEDEGKWTAHSPSVPGVYGVGATRREAEADFIDALSEMLAYLRDIGEHPPKRKRVIAGVVEVG